MIPRHHRSKSFPDKRRVENGLDEELDVSRFKSNNKRPQSPRVETQMSLKQEILQLEKRLRDQFAVRHTLEKALGSGSSTYEKDEPASVSKPTTELIKEIAVLELEVTYLEQYLLSLYRKAFDQQISLVSPSAKEQHKSNNASTTKTDQKISPSSSTGKDQRLRSPTLIPRRLFVDEDAAQTTTTTPTTTTATTTTRTTPNLGPTNAGFGETTTDQSGPKLVQGGGRVLDSNGPRCHSSLSYHHAAVATSPSNPLSEENIPRCHSSLSYHTTVPRPSSNSLSEALRVCQSQPISMTEYAASNVISLAEHLGTRISDHVPETPNTISEDMVKCMAAIFCKLGEPPNNGGLSSPNSSASSLGAFSPQHHSDAWSPGFGKYSSFDTHLDNPFSVEGLKEFSGPYSTMAEVQCIYRDSQKLGDVEYMLENFRSLISKLQEIDPKKMKHEEKLAFWINVHNALVMHAYLAYGIPQNNVKRVFLLLKAAYNVGGHIISADTIQSSILGCRMSRPGQWVRMFLSPRTKFKTRDHRQAYAIEHPEPLLHFALCSGSHSDPALRAYTPKRVLHELETAKEEYIRATFGMRKDQKPTLPKLVESYAKDLSLCSAGTLEMIQQSLPDSLRKTLKKCQSEKSRKSIEWMPHSFSFRYLISKELLK